MNGSSPQDVRIFVPEEFAGADECRSALKLLNCQEPEGIPHQDRGTGGRIPITDVSTQAPMRKCKSGQSKIRFGLAAAGREPKQVGNVPILAKRIGYALKTGKDEPDLERTPLLFDKRGDVPDRAGFSALERTLRAAAP